ncbi:hypothetical protein MRI28_11015 [Nocardiopsis dassonvillei]|uniref:hypothetical protein n=1 Tax=Nocardiopsis dassonvillei TaxID=2014 RepID=UPI00200C6A18|nr:hypothetical protein [Nocardiopsis dassonvillei]MCK9870163.1 hypothetical protein [Nocardiopsis dassonvillei]
MNHRLVALIVITALVVGALALSYGTLSTFFIAYAPGGSHLWGHGLALLVDLVWVCCLILVMSGNADWSARSMFYAVLAISVIAAGFFGFTTGGVVMMLVFVLPAFLTVGMELVWARTFLVRPKLAVTNTFSFGDQPNQDVPNPDLLSIANDILSRPGRRPGRQTIASRYDLSDRDSRKVVELLKGVA